MTNICLLDYNYFVMGGTEKVLSCLANELSLSYNVSILSICGDESSNCFKINDNIKVTSIHKEEGRIREMIFKSIFPLKSYFKNNKIDKCLIFGYYPITQILPVMPFVKTKFIFCDHGALCNQLEDKKTTFFRKIASKVCHKTVALTEKSMNDYIKIFKLKKEKVTYIYNWIEDDLIEKSTKINYNINSKKIISAGRFGKEKGFNFLIDTCKIVFEKHPDWSLDLFGDGETLSQIKNQVKENCIEKNVNFMGMSNNLCDLYSNYSMYVLPSYREGLPLVLLEAKANKLPIISFDINTGPSEIISQGIDGFLIKPYNTVDMAEKICYLIENPEKRMELSNNYKNKMDLFNKKTILKKWIELIESL